MAGTPADILKSQHIEEEPHGQKIHQPDARGRATHGGRRRLETIEHARPARELKKRLLDEIVPLVLADPELPKGGGDHVFCVCMTSLRFAQTATERSQPRRSHRVTRAEDPAKRDEE